MDEVGMSKPEKENRDGISDHRTSPGTKRDDPQIPSPESRGSLKRRDMLKAITAVPAAALVTLNTESAQKISSETPASAKPVTTRPAADKLKILNQHEWKSIRVLS